MRAQVGVIGAGPAGLMLGRLLQLAGIDHVILEARSRQYVLDRVRAGVLEQGTVDMLTEAGVGERLAQEGLRHDGMLLRFDDADHIVDLTRLTGKHITVYGQQEVVRDLIAQRDHDGLGILFDTQASHIEGIDGAQPIIHFNRTGQDVTLSCDYVVAADGFHGIGRQTMPAEILRVFERVYPFAWLGILANSTAPEHVGYAHHDHGFALSSARSPHVSRYYIQCAVDEDLAAWSDERIWDELDVRLTNNAGLSRGPITQKGITPMRSFVAEPMRYGRLFLAGDAAHIVPPTGAKGMNLAIADIRVLAQALVAHYRERTDTLLDAYSATCLDRIWKVTRFSWWLTSLMHKFPGAEPFDDRLQIAQLRHLFTSEAAAADLAGNYVGLPYAA